LKPDQFCSEPESSTAEYHLESLELKTRDTFTIRLARST